MRAVVTGGAGFIGHHMVNFLIEIDWEVVIVDNLSTGFEERINPGATFLKLDILKDPFPDISYDVMFHFASPISVEESLKNPELYRSNIIDGTRRLVEWSKKSGCNKIVAASTAAVYGNTEIFPTSESSSKNPISPYARYKLEMESLLSEHSSKDLKVVALRFFNVYGEGQRDFGGYLSAVPIFLSQYKRKIPITVTGDGSQTRDWVHVKDVVRACYESQDNTLSEFSIYNVASGHETPVIDLAKSFDSDILFIEKRREPARSLGDISKISREVGWAPSINLLSWVKENRNL